MLDISRIKQCILLQVIEHGQCPGIAKFLVVGIFCSRLRNIVRMSHDLYGSSAVSLQNHTDFCQHFRRSLLQLCASGTPEAQESLEQFLEQEKLQENEEYSEAIEEILQENRKTLDHNFLQHHLAGIVCTQLIGNGDTEPVCQQGTIQGGKARKEGLLSLEEAASDMDEPFLKKGILLIVDGTDPDLVRAIMETELVSIEGRHKIKM